VRFELRKRNGVIAVSLTLTCTPLEPGAGWSNSPGARPSYQALLLRYNAFICSRVLKSRRETAVNRQARAREKRGFRTRETDNRRGDLFAVRK
jgi:hypothetical protein